MYFDNIESDIQAFLSHLPPVPTAKVLPSCRTLKARLLSKWIFLPCSVYVDFSHRVSALQICLEPPYLHGIPTLVNTQLEYNLLAPSLASFLFDHSTSGFKKKKKKDYLFTNTEV